jgi:cobyrinic acid a,c-diamide synthase
MIQRQTVRDQLVAYLNQKISLAQLVDWAEKVLNEEVLDPKDAPTLRNIIARIGVADVKAFGLTWEDCYEFLSSLGYRVEVKAA